MHLCACLGTHIHCLNGSWLKTVAVLAALVRAAARVAGCCLGPRSALLSPTACAAACLPVCAGCWCVCHGEYGCQLCMFDFLPTHLAVMCPVKLQRHALWVGRY